MQITNFVFPSFSLADISEMAQEENVSPNCYFLERHTWELKILCSGKFKARITKMAYLLIKYHQGFWVTIFHYFIVFATIENICWEAKYISVMIRNWNTKIHIYVFSKLFCGGHFKK